MCEQTEVHYLEGDVVWVKLGACWWPGKVRDVDKLPPDILESFRKKPIAAVQFFNEDKYEYVKNLDQICRYNCRRKNDFIKKGLDMYRSKEKEGSSFMAKFPGDVSVAEELTGGNPDILAEHEFAPDEKPNYRNIFGGEKKPEKKGKTMGSPKSSPSWKMKGSSGESPRSPTSSSRRITHPRIIRVLKGEEEDHDVRIRHQPVTPQRDTSPQGEPYKCYKCDFTSTRLNVIIMHSKSHSTDNTTNGEEVKHARAKTAGSSGSPRGRGRPKKAHPDSTVTSPKNRVKVQPINSTDSPRSSASTNVDTIENAVPDTRPKEIVPSPEKKSPKTQQTGKRKSTKSTEKTTKKKKGNEDIKEKLLAEWGDEDPEEEEKEMQILKQELSKGESLTSPTRDTTLGDELNDSTSKPSPKSTVKAKEISCFDFDEKADSLLDSELEERAKKFAEARKFPRIMDEKVETERRTETVEIPVEEKPKQEMVVSSVKVESEELEREEDLEEKVESSGDKETSTDENRDLSAEFENIMAETEMPSLPHVPESKGKDEDEDYQETLRVESSVSMKSHEHDYSFRQPLEEEMPPPPPPPVEEPPPAVAVMAEVQPKEEPVTQMSLDEMELDINSMPVVMGDALITEDGATKAESYTLAPMNSVAVTVPAAATLHVEKPSANIVHKVMTFPASSMLPTVSAATSPPISSTGPASRAEVLAEGGLSVLGLSSVSLAGHTATIAAATTSTPTAIAAPKVMKQVVKSVKIQPSTSGTTLTGLRMADGSVITQKGSASGNRYVVIQHASGKQMLYSTTTGKPLPQSATVKASGQSAQTMGKKLLIVKSQQGGTVTQEVLTTALQQGLSSGGKMVPQRIITSQGTILKQVNNPKLMQVTSQQMKAALAGKQLGGARLTMQSTPTKVVLPVQKGLTSQQGVKVVSAAGAGKSKGNTILIQTTQGSAMGATLVSRGPMMSAPGQAKLTAVPQTVVRHVQSARQKLTQSASPVGATVQRVMVSSAGRGTVQTVQTMQTVQGGQKVLATRPTLQPRMVVQKTRASAPVRMPNVGAIAGVQQVQQHGKKALPRAQILQKAKQPQMVQKVVAVQQPTLKATSLEAGQTITLPTLQPMQPEVTVAPSIQQSFQPGTVMLSSAPTIITQNIASSQTVAASAPLLSQEQLAQVITPTGTEQLGEAGTATYVLVTIDEQGALQPYDSSGLMTYDSSGQATDSNTRTLYIDSSSLGTSGDLENIFLAINNSAGGGTGTLLNLGQTHTVASTNISSAQHSSSVFNITDSQPAAPSGSQDILAAALANTDVFQPEGSIADSLTVVNSSQSTNGSVMTSRLLDPTPMIATSTTRQTTVLLPSLSSMAMPPANTAGVLETSLTLKPIMTPLEVPSAVSNLQQPPPPIPTSLELPLTITQPILSMPTSSPYSTITHPSSLHSSESESVQSSIASSSVSKVTASPIISSRSSLQPSMPLLSEDVSDSHVAGSDAAASNLENLAHEALSHESETVETSGASTSVEHHAAPSYAQVPEVSSHITDEPVVTVSKQLADQSQAASYHDVPESSSEVSASVVQESPDIGDTQPEHAVSTSYALKEVQETSLKDRSEIGSSEPPQNNPAMQGYASIESSSEAIACGPEPVSVDGTQVPYEEVESTSQSREVTGDPHVQTVQEPSLQPYIQAPESTSGVVCEAIESNSSGSFPLPSYSQAPESTSVLQEEKELVGSLAAQGNYSDVPESTSHIADTAASSNSPTNVLDSSVLHPYQVPESSSEASVVSYEDAHAAPDAASPSSNQTGYASSLQVPESTSQMHDVLAYSDSSTEVSECTVPVAQSMPILLDSGMRATKRHVVEDATDSSNDLDHAKRVKIDDTER